MELAVLLPVLVPLRLWLKPAGLAFSTQREVTDPHLFPNLFFHKGRGNKET